MIYADFKRITVPKDNGKLLIMKTLTRSNMKSFFMAVMATN